MNIHPFQNYIILYIFILFTEDAGWIKDSQLKLEQFIKEQDLISSAKLLAEKRGIVKLWIEFEQKTDVIIYFT